MCDQKLSEHCNVNKILGAAINFSYQQEMNEMQPQTFEFEKICQNKKMINAHAL